MGRGGRKMCQSPGGKTTGVKTGVTTGVTTGVKAGVKTAGIYVLLPKFYSLY